MRSENHSGSAQPVDTGRQEPGRDGPDHEEPGHEGPGHEGPGHERPGHERPDYEARRDKGLGRAFALAALIHLLLFAFLYFGIQRPVPDASGVQAEIWT
ncbi:MAG: hypothetical protein ACRYHA_00130, partial [Janthinobacterium lividum]